MMPSFFTSWLTFSSHVEPTVDTDNLSGDIPRHGSGEKGDHLGYLFAGAKTTQRYGMQKLLTKFLRQLRRHFGFDKTRGDCVDRDSPGGDFPRHRLGKSQDTGFGRRIERLTRVAGLPHNRR